MSHLLQAAKRVIEHREYDYLDNTSTPYIELLEAIKTTEETPKADYNGWTNYETWNCKLWIDNEQGTQEYWRERAKEVEPIENEYMDEPRRKVYALADELKESFEEDAEIPLREMTGFLRDIMGAALNRVNWIEIAESLLDDVEE